MAVTKNTKKFALIATFLALAFLASYYNFSAYKPKIIRQIQDVKGLQTQDSAEPVLPEGSEKVGITKTSDTEQTTFHTNKTKKEVQDFYKNIFTSNKWELESQGIYNDFIIARYQKGNRMTSVMTFDTNDDYKTLVSLETATL